MTTPKLRFKEFDEDWRLDQVGKFLIEYKEKVPSSTDIEIYSSSRDGLKPQKEYFDNRELQNLGEYGIVPPNYFTYRHMSDDTTFKFNINLVGKKIAVSKEYPVFTTNELMNSTFLLLKLNESNDFKKFAIEQKKGGTRTRLYFKALCTWETLLPVKEEQTKIASFLSAVDEKISQLTQKHALLSQYKQGMMQKLFSQQIRFKADDGEEFGEWHETKFEKIGTFLKGKGISKADININGKTPCIRYGELYTSYGEVISKVISATNLPIENLILSKKNDVLIPASGETQIDIAIASCVLHDNVALSGDLNIFRTKESGVFLSYLICSYLKMQIAQLAQGNSVVHLYSSQLKGVELNLPCLEEQTKIANFLSAIDQKIEVVAKQIEQAKVWKKGLLQQMFV